MKKTKSRKKTIVLRYLCVTITISILLMPILSNAISGNLDSLWRQILLGSSGRSSRSSSSSSHSHDYDWEINRYAPHKASKECSCGSTSKTYSYNDPSLDFSLNMHNDVTSPDDILIFEEGVTLTTDNYTFSPDHNDDDAPNDYPDSIDTKTVSIDGDTAISLNSTSNISLADYSQGSHSIKAKTTDNYYKDYNQATETVDFYIGPYPTIYYNAHLTDNNNPNEHYDTIKINNIKLLSTYLPNNLRLYIYANGKVHNITSSSPSIIGYQYAPDGVTKIGYITKYDDITIQARDSILKNVLPTTKPYIMVRVNDNRPTSQPGSTIDIAKNPNVSKWAKFENLHIFNNI